MSAPSKVTRAAVGAVDSGDDVEERRLARAVGSDQADDFVGRDSKIEMVQRHHAAEISGSVRGLLTDSVMAATEGNSAAPAAAAVPPDGTAASR